jgi:phasin family protein
MCFGISRNALDKLYVAPHISHVAVQQRRTDSLNVSRCPTKQEMKMAKSKTTEKTIDTAENMESAMKNGAEALKTGFEKAVKNYDHFVGYGKETVEAYTKAANVAAKGAETLHNEIFAYSKQSFEHTLAATKALMATKSVHEAIELQSDFAKTQFDGYVSKMTQLSELVVATTKDSFAPIQGRVQAWVDVVQNARVAA